MIGSGGQSTREGSVEGDRKTSNAGRTYLEILGNFTNKTLEGELSDEKFSRLLVATNFTESDSSWAETMGLLDTTSCTSLGETIEKREMRRKEQGKLTAAVLRAADLAANCLRGALPAKGLSH